MSGHFVEVCEIHGTRYGSCRCIGPHEQRKVPCRPARCNVTRLPPPAVSAEPRVLLEFEEAGVPMRIVEADGRRRLQILFLTGWDFTDDDDRSDTAVAVYDAMRAREVRE